MPSREALVAEFAETGFLVIPDALPPAEVARLDAAFDRHWTDHPEDWARFSESFIEAPDVLPRTDAFDALIENRPMLDLVRDLMGCDIALEELDLMVRNPTDDVGDLKGWHRDIIRAYERRHEIEAISVIYYLTDVGPNDHCFTTVPGTHGPRVDMRPEDVRPGMEIDALGPAGSAYVFHARCIHAGKLKLGSRQRRTIHLYYGPADRPRTSEWTEIPARLADKVDPTLPPTLYAKARMAESIDGVGRKPRGMDPSLTTVDLLMHVQRAANRRPPQPSGQGVPA